MEATKSPNAPTATVLMYKQWEMGKRCAICVINEQARAQRGRPRVQITWFAETEPPPTNHETPAVALDYPRGITALGFGNHWWGLQF